MTENHDSRIDVSTARPGSGRGRAVYLWSLAFVCGAATMMVELTIVRLLAPFFGQTVFVWTNIIGVVLAALSLGYFVGGRLADRYPSQRLLSSIILAAGLGIAAAPFLAQPFARFLIAEDLPLQQAFDLLNRSSFAVTCMLFGLPLALLGVVSPFVVKLIHLQGTTVGRGAGSVYALSTIGSLFGTFLPTHFLVPAYGARTTLLIAATALTAIALPGLWRNGRRGARVGSTAALGVLLSLVAMTWSQGVVDGGGGTLLFARDSAYQYVRVVERPPEEGGAIELKLNEGLDSFHSVLVPNQILTGGLYYDYFNLMPLLRDKTEAPIRGLIIGLAAGTVSRQLHHFFDPEPGLELEGVEIDPLTVEVGQRYFDLSPASHPHLRIIPDQDGRIFLEHSPSRYDLIVIDAYAQQVYIPFHLVSREFFEETREHLVPGGIGAMNVGFYRTGPVEPMSDPVVAGIANTAASTFGRVHLVPVENSRNVILFFRRDDIGTGEIDLEALSRGASDYPELASMAQYFTRSSTVRTHIFDPGLPVFTDDWAPIERLSEASLKRQSGTVQ